MQNSSDLTQDKHFKI